MKAHFHPELMLTKMETMIERPETFDFEYFLKHSKPMKIRDSGIEDPGLGGWLR